jgi:hypothetical protein
MLLKKSKKYVIMLAHLVRHPWINKPQGGIRNEDQRDSINLNSCFGCTDYGWKLCNEKEGSIYG